MGLKDMLADKAKELTKGKAKAIVKKVILKYVLPYVGGIILIAGVFLIITGAIKDAAEKIAETTSSLFSIFFDNSSDFPTITIDDKLIESIKEELEKDAIDVDATYLTDKLLKKSLEAYYATQYPYIEGANYTDDTVKGCIYLKRGTNSSYMSYINYNSFQEKLGTGKSQSEVDNVKNYFSMDKDENIVIATWSRLNDVSESAENGYQQQGSTQDGYAITEYKINQKAIAGQYAMSYKLPILLANLYSNEGFGIAVAELGINSKIELTVLDATTKVETVSKETFKMNYKATGTYTWKKVEQIDISTQSEEGTLPISQDGVTNPETNPVTNTETIITGNFPDLILYGREGSRNNWFEEADMEKTSELLVPRSLIPISGTEIRGMLVINDEISWCKNVPEEIYYLYPELREELMETPIYKEIYNKIFKSGICDMDTFMKVYNNYAEFDRQTKIAQLKQLQK